MQPQFCPALTQNSHKKFAGSVDCSVLFTPVVNLIPGDSLLISKPGIKLPIDSCKYLQSNGLRLSSVSKLVAVTPSVQYQSLPVQMEHIRSARGPTFRFQVQHLEGKEKSLMPCFLQAWQDLAEEEPTMLR